MFLQQQNIGQKMKESCLKTSEAINNLTKSINKLKENKNYTCNSKFHK